MRRVELGLLRRGEKAMILLLLIVAVLCLCSRSCAGAVMTFILVFAFLCLTHDWKDGGQAADTQVQSAK